MLKQISYVLMGISAFGSVIACTKAPARSSVSDTASILEAPNRNTASAGPGSATPTQGGTGCGLKPYTATFAARKMTSDEQGRILLPYDTYPQPIQTLQIGDSSGGSDEGLAYVQDSQVLFSIDLLDLPPKDAIAKLDSASLRLTASIWSNTPGDPFLRHQMLCFLDEAICSGEYIGDPAAQDNINLNFFRESGGPVNPYFALQHLDGPTGQVDGHALSKGQLTLDLNELLKPDEHSQFRGFTGVPGLNVLYGDTPAAQRVQKRTLHLAVAADTYVADDATLTLSMTEDTCKSAELAARPETAR